MSRYVVIGAGAIGVTFAAELHRSGHAVTLIGRGAQLDAARSSGITYARPDGTRTLGVEVLSGPEEITLTDGDVLILATKTQDAGAAIAAWAAQPVALRDGGTATAGASLPLLTTQNGLEAERIALRHFTRVIAGVLALPANYVQPGVVVAPGAPAVGAAWIGAFPDGEDPRVEELARVLRRANIETAAVPDISSYKRSKLAVSSTFALDALYAPTPLRDRAAALLRDEAVATFEARGLPLADLTPAGRFELQEVPGYAYGGTSTWQSLARAGSLETDYINGEVVLQARLAGRAAPANEAITDRLHAAARSGGPARAFGDEDLLTTLPQLGAPLDGDVLIDAFSLARQLESDDPPAVLDVRWKLGDPHGRRHHAEGHIPGAVYVDLDRELAAPASAAAGRHPLPDIETFQASALAWGLKRGQAVVVYDDNGGMSAARAWWLLRWAGVADVRILDGALGAWRRARLPLETGERKPTPGDVELAADRLPVLDAEQAAELAATGVLLDARAQERYRGELEPVDPRAGHIPGALSAPTSDNLAGDGRFLDAQTLSARFAAFGADALTRVGVYCGSGVTAAHAIAALKIAGIDAAMFPGSWSAWSSDPDRPVALGARP